MKLVEIHQIKRNHKYFKEIDQISFKSKNVYNSALYLIKNQFNLDKSYLNYYQINRLFVDNNQQDYIQLPRKISNNILQLVDRNFKAFFKALKAYNKDNSKFFNKPNPPKYKHSILGRFIVPFEKGAILKSQFKKHRLIGFSGTNIRLKTKITSFKDIQASRIVPTIYGYKIEIIYHKIPLNNNLNKANILGLDLGLNNLVAGATTTNKSFIIKGTPLKSINQFYNKKKGQIQTELSSTNKRTSKRLIKLTNKRNNKIKDYLHKSSKRIIEYCIQNDIGTIVLGHNDNWKQEINLGKRNNQNFVQVPFNDLIEQIKYKCELNNIEFTLTEESYTSKCSFIDDESLNHQDNYLGCRIKRGLFKSKLGCLINADINGALNIIKKVNSLFNVSNTLYHGLEGVAVYPSLLNV